MMFREGGPDRGPISTGVRGPVRSLRGCVRALGLAVVGLGMVSCGAPEPVVPMSPAPAPAAETPKLDDDALAARYAELRAGFDAAPATFGGVAGTPEFTAMSSELRTMGNQARDVHLKANAALLLGAMHQERGQWAEAAGAFRRAASLVPDDAGPSMALARVLAEGGEFAAAAEAQAKAVALDPDNLEQYLALGELHLRAGDRLAGAKAYADYEVRRTGLIDGLTLRRDGAYQIGPDDRIACAESLASASDVGTAFALLYALQEEPEARVRAAIVRSMGVQRLLGYQPRLTAARAKEADPEVREAIDWALAEIARAPVDTKLEGPPPVPTPSGGKAGPAATPVPTGGSDQPADASAAPTPEAGADAKVASSASAP